MCFSAIQRKFGSRNIGQHGSKSHGKVFEATEKEGNNSIVNIEQIKERKNQTELNVYLCLRLQLIQKFQQDSLKCNTNTTTNPTELEKFLELEENFLNQILAEK